MWRLRGSKAKVEGKVGEMLHGPGAVLGGCGKAGQLLEGALQLCVCGGGGGVVVWEELRLGAWLRGVDG